MSPRRRSNSASTACCCASVSPRSEGLRLNITMPLFEAPTTLPQKKGNARIAASNYAALIAVMDPRVFIRLCVETDQRLADILTTVDVSLADFRAGKHTEFNPLMYNMPFLEVFYPEGRVRGHEGRHRAARVLKAGGTKFPVTIYFRAPHRFSVT